MAFAGAAAWALGPHAQGGALAPLSAAGRRVGEDPLHGRSDNMAQRYAMFADDSSAEAKRREASMLFCAAEAHLADEVIAEALKSAVAALPLFRELGDQCAVHDTLRVIIHAHRMEANFEYEDRPVEAERFAKQELAAFEASGDRRGEAAMLLSVAECLCDHRGVRRSQLADAEDKALRALDLFREAQDDKMAAIALLELARIHAMRGEHDGVLDKASEARQLFRRVGDKAGDARALHGVAIADVLARRLPDGVVKIREALQSFKDLGIRKQEAFELCVLAEVFLEDEKPLKALPVAREALSVFRDIDYGKGWEATSLYAVVRSLLDKGQPEAALKAAREGADRLYFQLDRRQQVFGQQVLVDALLANGLPEEALEVCQRAREVAQDLEDKRLEISVLHATMWTHMHEQDWIKAMEQMEEVSNLAQEIDDDHDDAVAVHNMAFLHLQRAEHRAVQEKSDEACGLFQKAESKRGEAASLMVAAMSFSDQDRVQDAIAKANQAQELYSIAGDARGEGEVCALLAELHLQREDCDRALQASERGVELMKHFLNKRLEARALRQLARVQLEAEKPQLAERAALSARDAATEAQDRAEMTQAQLQLTQVYASLAESDASSKSLEKALRSASEAVALSGRCNDRGLVAIARFVRAQLLRGTARYEEAERTAEDAMRWFRKAEDALGEARTLVLQGDIALGLGRKDDARSLAKEAMTLAAQIGASRAESEAAELMERVAASEKLPIAAAPVAAAQPTVASDASQAAAAAPAPTESVAKPEPQGLDVEVVKQKVLEMTKNLMAGDDDLENDSPFMEAGMDSLSSVQLMSELGREFQMAMSPSLVFDFPTINALAEHLVEESKAGAY